MLSKKTMQLFLTILFVTTTSAFAQHDHGGDTEPQPFMFAHFIDMGQADSTLLEFPCGAILIDAGAQNTSEVHQLTDYLAEFFRRRPDLDNTLESVIITHNHIDHTRALKSVFDNFTVKRYIDNGQTLGLGSGIPRWVRENEEKLGVTVAEILDSDVRAIPGKAGLTNDFIDPIECEHCNPEIRILAGQVMPNPGWPMSAFKNKNNHSIAIRVDFGESSFLFTGDLQKHGIDRMVEHYDGTSRLNVDVYQVGHHGSHNGTTVPLMTAMTPEIAVISCGKWNWGRYTEESFCAWQFGHPRTDIINMLINNVSTFRSEAASAFVADGVRNFKRMSIRKRIYSTSWDGTIRLRASLNGKFRATRWK